MVGLRLILIPLPTLVRNGINKGGDYYMVKVRIEGTKEEIEKFIDDFMHYYSPVSVSKFYPNKREPYSREGRVYISFDTLLL